MYDTPRLLSRPVGVEWAGWRTDTVALQRCGWEVAVEFDPAYYRYRLLLRHKMMRLYAVSDATVIEHIMDSRYADNAREYPVFRICGVAPSIQSLQVPSVNFAAFREIDAEPRYVETRIQRPEDFNIFAAPVPGSKGEVLIDGANMDVIGHLEAIKRLQEGQQEEIRQRILDQQRHPDAVEKHTSAEQRVVALVNYRRAA